MVRDDNVAMILCEGPLLRWSCDGCWDPGVQKLLEQTVSVSWRRPIQLSQTLHSRVPPGSRCRRWVCNALGGYQHLAQMGSQGRSRPAHFNNVEECLWLYLRQGAMNKAPMTCLSLHGQAPKY